MPLNFRSHINRRSHVILRARVVLPISQPPIKDGAVSIAGNRIVSVRPWKSVPASDRARAVDLGEVVLLPGLVNAHCHLDYTAMAGQLAPPSGFVDWLKLITTNKAGWMYSDFAESWVAGANMLLRTGTTTVGDIEMVPDLLPEVWNATPLRVFSFLEMTGVISRRPPPEIIREAMALIDTLPAGRCEGGLSPHAPYSTTPELLRLAAATARRKKLRLVTHIAESDQEFEMFVSGSGAMFEWLSLAGRDMSDCGLGSPVQHLHRHGALGEHLLAVHVNYLAPGDALLLAKNKVSVVHCPRSHTYFQHRQFPLAALAAAGVNVCLGTDSLASTYKPRKQKVELNLFDEMRELALKEPDLPPATILEMATRNGAQALGLRGQTGELSPKTFADLIAIPHAGKTTAAAEAAVHYRGDVAASMIDGQWVVKPQGVLEAPEPASK
ncbi:MAG: Amidohydrolase [Pedosphaera sp.]|nr:Amidohydrolase [Pedosphaera sp.]